MTQIVRIILLIVYKKLVNKHKRYHTEKRAMNNLLGLKSNNYYILHQAIHLAAQTSRREFIVHRDYGIM